MDIPAILQKLGFSEYEGRAYVSLARAVTRNGYEVAKDSGMPRANVYPVLERLVQRGAARRLKTREGVRYAAVPPERLLRRLEKEHSRTLNTAREALQSLSHNADSAPVFNLGDPRELQEQARGLIDGAQRSLLVAIRPPEAAQLAQALREARERGVVITTLCMEACAKECGGCQGNVHRICLTHSQQNRWLLLVADDQRMVAGEIHAHEVRAVSTEQPLVVMLTAAYIRQSLALVLLGGELGERFHGLVSEPARQILDALHPEGGFLAHLNRVAGVAV